MQVDLFHEQMKYGRNVGVRVRLCMLIIKSIFVLILGEDTMQVLEDTTLTAEDKYSTNFILFMSTLQRKQ